MIKFLPLSFFKQSGKPRINIVIKFLPLFAKQRVSDIYTLQSLKTYVDCSAKNLLVQFHHKMTGREGMCMCVSCAKNLLVKFDLVKMLPSEHGGVAYVWEL